MFKKRMSYKTIILLVFFFFVLLTAISFIWYGIGLNPKKDEVEAVINKFTYLDYSIPYYVAERYSMWLFMRSYFYVIHYTLTLLGVVATLITVFYASNDSFKNYDSKSSGTNENKRVIIFFSLMSLCFTIVTLYINPITIANMSQHAWRQLDICISETVYNQNLSFEEKNRIIINKVKEMELYIETFEH